MSAVAAAEVRELEATLVHAEGLGCRVAATWSQDRPDGLDLVVGRDELPPARARVPCRGAPLANSPQIGRMGSSMARESYVAPRTETQKTLCRLVAGVLGLKRVGLQDNFYVRRDGAVLQRVNDGVDIDVPVLPFDGGDVAEWLRAERARPFAPGDPCQQAELDRRRSYWCTRLAGLPGCLSLRTDYPRPAVKSYQGSSAELRLNLIPASGGGGGGPIAVAAFEVRPVPVESGTAKFDLNLMVQETEAGPTGYLEYSADLFAADPEADLAGLRARADRPRSEGGVG